MMILLYDGAILIVAIEADLSRNLTKTCRTWKSASVTRVRIHGTFGLLRQTVVRDVGLGTSRQIQFALRLNF